MTKLKKRGFQLVAGACILVVLLIIICNAIVMMNSRGRIYDSPDEAPSYRLGLLLGTSPINTFGIHNGSFDNRIHAAADLYKAGKIQKLIVSGGDYTRTEKYGCDEPRAMRDSLILLGVNPDDIFMDYEGLTTIKSIAKVKNYYSYRDTITIISQGYHTQRAITMADKLGIPAIGYSAEVPPSLFYKTKNYLREALARVKMVFSLYFIPLPGADSFKSDDKKKFEDFLISKEQS